MSVLLSQALDGSRLGQFFASYGLLLVPLALGLVGVYLLMPQAGRSRPVWGAVTAAAALILGGIVLVQADMALTETVLFYAFAAIAVIGGVLLITQSNPVHAALSFALVVLSTCGLFLLQGAPFLMASTIIVYAGAIIVTFLFVIMLAQQEGFSSADQRSREPFLATLAGFVLLAALLVVLQRNYSRSEFDAYLHKLEHAARASSPEEAQASLGGLGEFMEKLDSMVPNPMPQDTKDPLKHAQWSFWGALANADANSSRLEPMKQYLAKAHEAGLRIRALQGSLEPATEVPLSANSGTPPNAKGDHRLPARNVAGLGRSLFSDYLLPVELAGVLLLVATIGAIVIAGRHKEGA